jgi:hypothetical protein
MKNPYIEITTIDHVILGRDGTIRSDIDPLDRELLGDFKFLPKQYIMDKLKLDWKPQRGLMSIHVIVRDENGLPTMKDSKCWSCVDTIGVESYIMALAKLSDLHGIVGIFAGSIWLDKTNDPDQLNIDADVVDGIKQILDIYEENERMAAMSLVFGR